jgi:hypothetical protein
MGFLHPLQLEELRCWILWNLTFVCDKTGWLKVSV